MTTKYLGDGIWARRTSIENADIMIPIETQSRFSETLQLLNAVSIVASGNTVSSWIEVDGFSAMAITLTNDSATENSIVIQWSNDGVNLHGEETLATGTSRYKPVYSRKMANYMRVKINNIHTSAHTMSAWVNLQV